LVNRGWIPFTGYRDQLPDISIGSADGGPLTLSGRLDELPSAGLASGRAAPEPGRLWPKVTSFPTHGELQTALGTPIASKVLLLDAGAAQGYVRDWKPPGMDPSRHFSYAIQWWGFATVLLVIYFGLNFRKVS
jgi:cytochrome oxidase assembly protein ShyY1